LQRNSLGDYATELVEIDYPLELLPKTCGASGKEERILKP
jgi:hypothetical protein